MTTTDNIKDTLSRIDRLTKKPEAVAVPQKPVPKTTQKEWGVAEPGRKAEFELFKVWCTIPNVLLKPGNAEKFGIRNELALKLLGIRTRTEFAETFQVSRKTLYTWEQELERRGLTSVMNDYIKMAQSLTPSVLNSLATHAIRDGDAPSVKLWVQIIEGWREKSEVQATTTHFDVVGYIEQIEKRNKELRGDLPDSDDDNDEDD